MAFDPGATHGGFCARNPETNRFVLVNFNAVLVRIDGELKKMSYKHVTDNHWIDVVSRVLDHFDWWLRRARMILVERQMKRKMVFIAALILGQCVGRYREAFVHETDPKTIRNFFDARTKKRFRGRQKQHEANKIESGAAMKRMVGERVYKHMASKLGVHGKFNYDAMEAMQTTIAGEALEKAFRETRTKLPKLVKAKRDDCFERRFRLRFDASKFIAKKCRTKKPPPTRRRAKR